MKTRRAKLAALLVIVVSFGFFVLNSAREVKVSFSNGFQLLILKTSYGEDHVYYDQAVRRAIASNGLTEGLWRRLEEHVPAVPRFLRISNRCGSVQQRTPTLVVFSETSGEAALPAWQFCPVASSGEEGAPLKIEVLRDEGPRLVDRSQFMLIAYLDKQPNKVRIYEVDSRMNTQRLLAEVPVPEGSN